MEKFFYEPTKPFSINQGFGESKLCFNPETKKFSSKINGVCEAPTYSYYESVGLKGHNGLDLLATMWQRVYNPVDGDIKELATEIERGLGVGIVTREKFKFDAPGDCGEWHYAKIRTWHHSALNVELGDRVEIGRLQAYAGTTGYSTGPHVHFELKPVELSGDGTAYNAHQTNGYYGAVNPLPYLDRIFALDAKSAIERMSEQLAKAIEWLADYIRQRSNKQ